ncbi:putative G-protein coupled receptor 148 [Mixophyes fleayi]|uniref:putative G-protein coupled receptor 148 n=1 Tax=Mixophyes fleayi TaxID=3061075 RepID=UPI003F4E3D95
MLVDYMNCTLYYPNPPSIITSNGTLFNNTAEDSQCVSQSISKLQMLLIPSFICSIVTISVNPPIIITILTNDKLRKEIRYIFLVNVLISDLIFLLFNTIISTCNVIRWYIYRVLCFTMIVLTFAAHSSCVLTFTVMVLDTYIAICFPLHYYSLLSMQRTKKILLVVWFFSTLFPVTIILLSETIGEDPLEKQNACLILYYGPEERKHILVTVVCATTIFFLMLCSVMMTYFYIKLYTMTRQSGIWVSRFSRARITLLTHSILLCLYIVPALILAAEIIMFKYSVIGINVRMWMSACNNGLMMMMPRALTPFLYGLRYREISATLKLWFSRNRVSFMGTDIRR